MSVKVRKIIRKEIDVPGLGKRIEQARKDSQRSVSELAKAAGFSRHYWYQLENEAVMGGVAEETLRKVEEVLGIDFGVSFEE